MLEIKRIIKDEIYYLMSIDLKTDLFFFTYRPKIGKTLHWSHALPLLKSLDALF